MHAIVLKRRVAFQKPDTSALLKALWVEKKVDGESGARRARNGELFSRSKLAEAWTS